jgi:hypothetical protein
VNLEPGNGAWLVVPIAGIEAQAIKSRHRLQARKAEKRDRRNRPQVIHVMRVIVVPLIARQFPGSL